MIADVASTCVAINSLAHRSNDLCRLHGLKDHSGGPEMDFRINCQDNYKDN